MKSFSMPNSYHNIYGDLKSVKFVEFYRPTSGGEWVYEVFSFNLAEGYTETDNLAPRRSLDCSSDTHGNPKRLTLYPPTLRLCFILMGRRPAARRLPISRAGR